MMIQIDEAVVRQALEAMQRIQDADNDSDFLNPRQADQLDEAITALRRALEQTAQQKPVAICCNCLGTKHQHADDPEWKGRCDCAPPEPAQQEPVAWIYSRGKAEIVSMNYVPGVRATPLYTRPPAREPLSREQALKIVEANPDIMTAIRMTEAAHGIGEKK